MYDAIKEAQKLARMEEAREATKPKNIGSLFVKFNTVNGPMTINVHRIEAYVPASTGTHIYLIGSDESILAYHNYDEINSLFSLSIFK